MEVTILTFQWMKIIHYSKSTTQRRHSTTGFSPFPKPFHPSVNRKGFHKPTSAHNRIKQSKTKPFTVCFCKNIILSAHWTQQSMLRKENKQNIEVAFSFSTILVTWRKMLYNLMQNTRWFESDYTAIYRRLQGCSYKISMAQNATPFITILRFTTWFQQKTIKAEHHCPTFSYPKLWTNI